MRLITGGLISTIPDLLPYGALVIRIRLVGGGRAVHRLHLSGELFLWRLGKFMQDLATFLVHGTFDEFPLHPSPVMGTSTFSLEHPILSVLYELTNFRYFVVGNGPVIPGAFEYGDELGRFVSKARMANTSGASHVLHYMLRYVTRSVTTVQADVCGAPISIFEQLIAEHRHFLQNVGPSFSAFFRLRAIGSMLREYGIPLNPWVPRPASVFRMPFDEIMDFNATSYYQFILEPPYDKVNLLFQSAILPVILYGEIAIQSKSQLGLSLYSLSTICGGSLGKGCGFTKVYS